MVAYVRKHKNFETELQNERRVWVWLDETPTSDILTPLKTLYHPPPVLAPHPLSVN